MLLAYLVPLAALGAILAAAVLCWPPLRALTAMSSLAWSESAGAGDEAVERLGGPGPAAEVALRYLRMPASLAPHRDAALLVLERAAPRAARELSSSSADPDPEVRAAVAGALGGAPAEQAAPVLAGMLDDSDEAARTAAAASLAATGSAPGIPAIDYERCLREQGWKLQGHPIAVDDWRAAVLFEADGSRGWRLLLSRSEGGVQRIAAEWRVHRRKGWVSDPLLIDVGGGRAPELVFAWTRTGTVMSSRTLRVFDLEGGVREITPPLPPGRYLTRVGDLDCDGRHELLVLLGEFENYWWFSDSPQCWRVYSWDRAIRGFVDSSADYPAFYRARIRSHCQALTGRPGMAALRGSWGSRAVSLLLDYWSMDRADEGALIFSRHMRRVKRRLNPQQRKIVEALEEDLADKLCLARG
jgi:hypothetical protein